MKAQIKFIIGQGWHTFSIVITFCSKMHFPDFSPYAFRDKIKTW